MKFRILVIMILLFAAACVFAQDQGPMNTPRINSTYYVGSLSGLQYYPTIQSAVTDACASGGRSVVDIPASYTGSDPISGVTGGCTNAVIKDEHNGLPTICYTWQSVVYSSSGVSCYGTYTLPIAQPTTLGGVKPDGTSCTVNATTGVLSCTGGGGVTSVTATAPIHSSGSTTPNITCDVASGSQSGCLAATDWSTFNNKQPAGSYLQTANNLSDVASVPTAQANIGVNGPTFNVVKYGAIGNGSTDDTAAIQAAFTACWNNGSGAYGGIVQFPGPHTYVISSTINAYDGCQIQGGQSAVTGGYQQPSLTWQGSSSAVGTVVNVTAITVATNSQTSGSVYSAAFPQKSGTTQNSIAAHVVTVTGSNSLVAGQWVEFAGLTSTIGVALNRCIGQVTATPAPTGSSFTVAAPCTATNGTASDTGTATTVSVAMAFDGNARFQQAINNIVVQSSNATTYPLSVGFLMGSRVDTGTRFFSTQVANALEYGYYFGQGGINIDFDGGWRSDAVRVAGIYWRNGGSDDFGIYNGTVDNDICLGCTTPTSGAAVLIDNQAACGITFFTSHNVKVEINTSLTSPLGAFTLYQCPSTGNGIQALFNFDNTWITPGARSTAGFNLSAISVFPANDKAITITASNVAFGYGTGSNTSPAFLGIPNLTRTYLTGSNGWMPFLSYAPSNKSSGVSNAAFSAPMQMVGDAQVSQLWQDGVAASPLMFSDTAYTALPNGTTLYKGQVLAPPSYWMGANGKRYALDVVYQSGTTGTPNGGSTTCSAAGSNIMTCTSATDLSVGQFFTINGVNSQITLVDATNSSAVVVTAMNGLGTFSSQALSFNAPVLGLEMQIPTKSAAIPTTLTWSQGDMEQNSGATANGVAAWVNVSAGTPGTWAGIPLGDSSGKINISQVTGTPSTSPVCPNGTSGALTTSGCVGAGTTANSLTLTNTGGASPGATFNGSAAVTADAHTLGAGGLATVNSWTLTNYYSNPQFLYNGAVYQSSTAATNGTNVFSTNPTYRANVWSTTNSASELVDFSWQNKCTNTAQSPVCTLTLLTNKASDLTPTYNMDLSAATALVLPTINLAGTTTPLLLNGSAGTATQCLISGGPGVTPSWGSCGSGSSGLSGMTAGQVPIAATASTVTSSKPLAGSGAGIVTGPTSATTAGHVVTYVDTVGTTQDGGALPTGTVTSVGWTGGIVSVATATSTPAFTIAGTSGGIPYFNSGTTWASSAALTHYGVVYGGGAAGAPVSTAADTTTTHALFATATAPAFRAIATTDIPTLNQNTTGTSGGVTGTAGTGNSLVLANATSGTITIQATTGALGAVTLTAPATTGTIALTSQIPAAQVAANLASSGSTGVTGQLPIAQVGSAGLSASNGVSIASTGAITLTYGTTANTVAQGNDSRITGAVQSGGALGTPSSGVITNLTGTCTSCTANSATSVPAANVASGALANGMTATTQSAGDNSTKLATTAYVDGKSRAWSCQPGLGDGLNAITAGTYLESTCMNTTGVTVTLTALKCFTDNAGSSTLNASGNTLGALLTGAITCSASFAAGSQSANVALTNGDYVKFTFVADGASKQSTWVITGTY